MKLYLILYETDSVYNKEWMCDSVSAIRELAEAKLAYVRLKNPTWHYELVTVEVPAEVAA